MKSLTEEEFKDRTQAILRSRKIFIDSGLTKNISVAFELYQKVLSEREREIFLSTQVYGNRPRTPLDKYERPVCECGSEMAFRMVPPNDKGIKVQLVCQNSECDIILNSDNDIQWWMSNLKVKDERI
jgi:hypothetical protein